MPIRQRYQSHGVEGARVGRVNWGLNTTFIVYRIGDTLIDTGPTNQWSAVKRFVAERPPQQLLITHHHEDHAGNAARIAKAYGMLPYAPELGRAKLRKGYRIPPIQKFIWGSADPVETQPLPQTVEISGGATLEAIHTPGHAKDLTCLYWQERGLFFSGDLYISKSIKYLRADENLGQLMDSIARVLRLEFDTVFCPHRGIVELGHQALADKLDNLKTLCGDAQALNQQGLELTEIGARLLGPEGWLAKVSFDNISKANLIREALEVRL